MTTARPFHITPQTFIFGPSGTSYLELTANGTVVQLGLGVEHFFNRSFGVRVEGTYANDTSFDEISDAPGREPRESGHTMLGASAVLCFESV
jgi:hypothetical protein